jgi:hypothetical protein
MTDKPLVYLISPFTKGDQFGNARYQMQMFLRLQNDGIVLPFAPLAMCAVQLVEPQTWQWWMDYDLAMLERYDACLRMNADYPSLGYSVVESAGADNEVAAFRKMGKPVFYSLDACYAWAAAGGWKESYDFKTEFWDCFNTAEEAIKAEFPFEYDWKNGPVVGITVRVPGTVDLATLFSQDGFLQPTKRLGRFVVLDEGWLEWYMTVRSQDLRQCVERLYSIGGRVRFKT